MKYITPAAVFALVSIGICAPTFVYIKNRNDSKISVDTARIADAAERAYPKPLIVELIQRPFYRPCKASGPSFCEEGDPIRALNWSGSRGGQDAN